MKWPVHQLSVLADRFISGGTPDTKVPDYWNGDIPWITGADFTGDGITIGRRYINSTAISVSATNIVPKGSILMVTRTGVGKIAIAPVDIAISQDITGIVLKQGVEAKYVLSAIVSKMSQLLAVQRGATIKGITRDDVKRLDIPLPPPSEQRRIVEILDQADHLRKLRDEADKKAERILPALFNKMFGDPATNPKILTKKPIGEVIRVRSGNFLPAKNMAVEGVYPVYGGNGINGYHSEFMIKERTIVIGRVGAYCGVVHYSEPNCWVTDNALYVTEKHKPIEDEYLAFALHHANLNRYAGQAGQPLISASRIYPVEILVPDEEEQKVFSRGYRDLEKLAGDRAKSKQELEKTFSLLMQRAFSGTLTVTWREAHMKELLAEMEQQAKYLN